MAEWTVEENTTGPLSFDISLDRRPVRYDCDDMHEVMQVLRQHGVETFTLIERDGYRTTTRVS